MMKNFVNENGNFTHSKIVGTDEQIIQLINKYKETRHYKELSQSKKIIMEMYIFPQIIEQKMVPQGMLLELIMPSSNKTFKEIEEMSKADIGKTITFDLPEKYIINNDI